MEICPLLEQRSTQLDDYRAGPARPAASRVAINLPVVDWREGLSYTSLPMRHTNSSAPVMRSRLMGMALVLLGCVSVITTGYATDRELTPDTALPVPPLEFDPSGTLVIRPSASSSEHDFDYLVGNWKLRNRKLASRLTNSTEWIAYESRVEMHQILNGLGNIDKYTEQGAGQPYEGVALRLFNPKTRLWSIYWADSNSATMDPPVVGSFENKIGHFFARDTYRGRPIIVVFRWDVRNRERPIWSQAFSVDEGKTWEWNSINVSERIP